jgi:hypothetical protein
MTPYAIIKKKKKNCHRISASNNITDKDEEERQGWRG